MDIYADTNFLKELYLAHSNAVAADRRVKQAQEAGRLPFPVPWLLSAELVNAFQYSVFCGRTGNGPRITPEMALTASGLLADDLARGILLIDAEPPRDELRRAYTQLVFRHTARHGFRTYDLLHVSSALAFGCTDFWSFDQRASKLAKLEGLKVL